MSKDVLTQFELQLLNCLGQCSDGASNMAVMKQVYWREYVKFNLSWCRTIIADLLDVTDELSRLCTSGTEIVRQLILFPRSGHCKDINFISRSVTCYTCSLAIFWHHHSGFSRSSTNLFLEDHEYLNDAGMHRYWNTLRTALGKVLRDNIKVKYSRLFLAALHSYVMMYVCCFRFRKKEYYLTSVWREKHCV